MSSTSLLRSLAAAAVAAIRHRRTIAAMPRHPAAAGAARRAAAHVAARPVSLEHLASALVTRTEAIRPAAWLADREVSRRTRWRRLPFLSRERCANQRPVHGAFVHILALIIVIVGFGSVLVRSVAVVGDESGVLRRERLWRRR